MKNNKTKEKVPQEQYQTCQYCGQPCDTNAEVIGYRLVTGEAWHVRCNPPK